MKHINSLLNERMKKKTSPYTQCRRDVPHGIVTNVLDCNIIVNLFECQSQYYVHFQTNILGKGINPLTSTPTAMG